MHLPYSSKYCLPCCTILVPPLRYYKRKFLLALHKFAPVIDHTSLNYSMKYAFVRRAPRKRHLTSSLLSLPSSSGRLAVLRAQRSHGCSYHTAGNNLITIRRVPLYKTRSLRRLISDNGKSVEELLSLAAAASSSSSGAPQSFPSAQLPIERLTNFLDVCAHTHPEDSFSHCSDSPQRSQYVCPLACRYSRAVTAR